MEWQERPLARTLIRASFTLSALGTSIPATAPGLLGILGGILTMSPYAVAAIFGLELGADTLMANRVFRI